MKLVIVDDDKDITYSIATALKEIDKSIEVLEANSGKECLKLLKTEKPDLILLDVMMPEMNGWELSIALKANKDTCNIPIVFLTCLDDPGCKRMGLTFGVDYLTKPFEAKELHKIITKILKLKLKN